MIRDSTLEWCSEFQLNHVKLPSNKNVNAQGTQLEMSACRVKFYYWFDPTNRKWGLCRPRRRYPIWAVLKIQYSTVQPDFFYQTAILCCHNNPVANSLQGSQQVANHFDLYRSTCNIALDPHMAPIVSTVDILYISLHRTDITTVGCMGYIQDLLDRLSMRIYTDL